MNAVGCKVWVEPRTRVVAGRPESFYVVAVRPIGAGLNDGREVRSFDVLADAVAFAVSL